LKHILCITHLM
ncbi:hypothetical protein CP061683_0111B, partial [Chlamydia psittaci 06-1683]